MELSQIKLFLALAETLNFTRAAQKCGVSQPTLSRSIQKLEAEMGGQLVRRERGRTHLTELGRMVQPRFLEAQALVEATREEATEFVRMSDTTLTVGVMCTVGTRRLVPLVEHLADRVPQLELRLKSDTGERLVDMLLDGDIDVALIGLPDYPEAIEAYTLFPERYVVAFAPGHRFEKLESVSANELAGETYLECLNSEFLVHFEQKNGEWPAELDVRFESENEAWIQAMIVSGLGCACVPQFADFGTEIKTRPLTEPEVWRSISLATVRGRQHSQVVNLFSRLCRSIDWEMNTTAEGSDGQSSKTISATSDVLPVIGLRGGRGYSR